MEGPIASLASQPLAHECKSIRQLPLLFLGSRSGKMLASQTLQGTSQTLQGTSSPCDRIADIRAYITAAAIAVVALIGLSFALRLVFLTVFPSTEEASTAVVVIVAVPLVLV